MYQKAPLDGFALKCGCVCVWCVCGFMCVYVCGVFVGWVSMYQRVWLHFGVDTEMLCEPISGRSVMCTMHISDSALVVWCVESITQGTEKCSSSDGTKFKMMYS